MFLVTVLLILLVVSSALPHKLTNLNDSDDNEQSGDFDLGINPFKSEPPEQQQKKISDDTVMRLFSNQQEQEPKQNNQKHQQQQHQQRQQKIKQQNRKSDLNEDVNDFIELIPKAEIKAKLNEYYRNDMDVQHIFEYIHGKDFQELRKKILDMPDVKDILQYLNKNGLNIKGVVRKIDNRLGISKIRPASLAYSLQPSFGTNTTIGGLNGLVEDVLVVLPQDEILILFFEKLDSSPTFAALIHCMGEQDFHRKYNTLWKSKELHSASAQLKKHKIDIVKLIQILQGYFIFGTV